MNIFEILKGLIHIDIHTMKIDIALLSNLFSKVENHYTFYVKEDESLLKLAEEVLHDPAGLNQTAADTLVMTDAEPEEP